MLTSDVVYHDEVEMNTKFDQLMLLLKPEGEALAVVSRDIERVIEVCGYRETWEYCWDNAQSTQQAVEAFLDCVELDSKEEFDSDGFIKALEIYSDI
jgi:hypothetical protein